MGTTERFVEINFAKLVAGRFFTERSAARATWPCSATDRYEALFERGASIRSARRSDRRDRVHGGRRHRQAPAGGFNIGQDDFAIIPYTTYRKQFGYECADGGGPFGGARRR